MHRKIYVKFTALCFLKIGQSYFFLKIGKPTKSLNFSLIEGGFFCI